MKILEIKNIEKLRPGYEHHWVIMSKTHSDIEYQNQDLKPEFAPYLWYHLDQEAIPDTYTSYFEEKLNLHYEEALVDIELFNRTLYNNSPIKASIRHRFKINKIPYGIFDNPEDCGSIIIISTKGFFPKDRVQINGGRGGFIWAELPAMEIIEDSDMLKRIRGLFLLDSSSALRVANHINKYIKKGGN